MRKTIAALATGALALSVGCARDDQEMAEQIARIDARHSQDGETTGLGGTPRGTKQTRAAAAQSETHLLDSR